MNNQFNLIKNILLQTNTTNLIVRMGAAIAALAFFIYTPDNVTAWLGASVLTTVPAIIYFESFEQLFKNFGIALLVYAVLLVVRLWGGSILWLGAFVFVAFLVYRAYKMRSWVRLWWAGYKNNMLRIWRGENRK